MSASGRPGMERLEEVPCIICGVADHEPCFEAYDRILGGGPYPYVRCRRCGLIYQDPRIKKEYIGEYYPGGYTWKEDRGERRGLRRLFNRLEKLYLLAVFGAEKKYVTDFCGRLGIRPRRVLDLGCGNAMRLYLYRKDGYETLGVEMSEDVRPAKELYGVDVVNSSVEDFLKEGRGGFDLITGYQIIEHFHDPVSVLEDLRGMLADGGLLVLQAPNADSLQFGWFRERGFFIESPRHTYFFNPATMRAVLEKAGFRVAGFHTKDPFFKLSNVILSMFPALDIRRMRRRESGGGYGFLRRLVMAFGAVALAPLTYLEGASGRGINMTVYAFKK